VPRSRWIGTVASPVASRTAGPSRAPRTLCFNRDAALRRPARVQRHGESTSCVSATENRAPSKRGGSTPSERRRRSSGGSGGPLEGRPLARQERDRPALPETVHGALRRRAADEIRVGDQWQVYTAGRRETVPLPKAWVDLHQLEAAVARVVLELHLRQPEVA